MQHIEKLLHSAAAEALTAAADEPKRGWRSAESTDVRSFIDELAKAKVKRVRKTNSMNENRYKETDKGYNSEAVLKKDGKVISITTDYLAK